MKHGKSLTSRMKCKRNFLILVNSVKLITGQTRPPKILNNLHQHNNNKQLTLRDSKPSQNMSENHKSHSVLALKTSQTNTWKNENWSISSLSQEDYKIYDLGS